MLPILTLHHVSLPVTDVARAKQFYGGVLELEELPRPLFDFDGAWYRVGDRQLHLIHDPHATFRVGRGVDTRDIHLAIRVASFRAAIEHLRARGYKPEATDELHRTREQPNARAGFPQVYLMDPDRNLIEINAERLD